MSNYVAPLSLSHSISGDVRVFLNKKKIASLSFSVYYIFPFPSYVVCTLRFYIHRLEASLSCKVRASLGLRLNLDGENDRRFRRSSDLRQRRKEREKKKSFLENISKALE